MFKQKINFKGGEQLKVLYLHHTLYRCVSQRPPDLKFILCETHRTDKRPQNKLLL